MQIYKARIKKPQYNIYTVNSNIDGANVYFDNEIVGSIIDGVCYIRVDKNVDTLEHTARLEGGSVPKTIVEYTFTGTSITVSANADSALEMTPAASYKNTTVYSYNSNTYDLNFADGAEVTINATPNTTKTELNWTPTTYNLAENFTEEAKQFKVTLTQAESNKTCVITINQSAGVEYTYTVNSDIEGATVLANGENIGTIENGQCVFTKWNTHAAESYPISFSGGTLVPKANEYHLSNTVVPAVSQLGATIDLSGYIKSTVRSYTPYSPTGNVTKNGSVTLNTKYNYTDSNTAYTINGDLVFDENQTTNKVTRTFTVTQTASGKQIEITVTQNAGVKYTYTINSNIEGATVKFGTETVGTINDGKLVVTKWNNHAAASYSVSFTGGTLVPKDTEYTFTIGDIPIQSAEAGTVNLSSYITSSKKVYTPQRPTGTVNRNNSVTLNTIYTSATNNVTYSPTTVTVTENQTTNPVDYSKTITQSESGKTVTAEFQQSAGVRYTYTVNSNIEGSKVSYSNGSTGTIDAGKHVLILWNSHAPASLTCTLSGGTLSEPEAYEYEFNITKIGNDDTSTDNAISVVGSGSSNMATTATSRKRRYEYHVPTTTFTISRNGSVTANETKSYSSYTSVSYSVTSKSQTWITNSGTNITVAKNPNDTARTGTITFTQAESNKTDVITVNQARGTYQYTINSNCEGGTVYFGTSSSSQTTNVGTISNGKCVFERTEASGYVRISGGVPESVYNQYIDDGYDTDPDDYSATESRNESSSSVFRWQGESNSKVEMAQGKCSYAGVSGQGSYYSIESYTQETGEARTRYYNLRRTKYHYRDTVYTAPATTQINGDSSKTMNYSSKTTNGSTQYGSWEEYNRSWSSWSNYNNKSGVRPTVSENVSWVNCSLNSQDNEDGIYTYTYTVNENTTTSDRTYKITFSRNGFTARTITGSQWRKPWYEMEIINNNAGASTTIPQWSATWTGRNTLSIRSLKFTDGDDPDDPSVAAYTGFHRDGSSSSWLNVEAYENVGNNGGVNGATLVDFRAEANTSTSVRSGKLILTQDYGDKSVTINCSQAAASHVITFKYVTGSTEHTFNWGSSLHGTKNLNTQILSDIDGSSKVPYVQSKTNGINVTITKDANTVNRYNVQITLTSDNLGSSIKSYDVVFAQTGSDNTIALRVNQPAP